jgi:hypothetical protein
VQKMLLLLFNFGKGLQRATQFAKKLQKGYASLWGYTVEFYLERATVAPKGLHLATLKFYSHTKRLRVDLNIKATATTGVAPVADWLKH